MPAEPVVTRGTVKLMTHDLAAALLRLPDEVVRIEINADVIDTGTMDDPLTQRQGSGSELWIEPIRLPVTFTRAMSALASLTGVHATPHTS